jgi:spermidine/putrescine transport system permease protein
MSGSDINSGVAADTYAKQRPWLLLPSWVILTIFIVMPLTIMAVYSFLTKEFRGGVVWQFSWAAYDQFFFDRGLFGDEPASIEWTYLNIYWRSVWQAGTATVLSLVLGFPTAYFIATRSAKSRAMWVFLITIPYWVNLLIRTVSMKFLLRENGPLNDFLMMLQVIDQPLHIINTALAVQLGLFYSYLPFMVLPIYASIERYNFTLSEAAADLYASKLATLWRIVLPAVKPGVIAGCILVFVPSLGAFLAPDLLGGAKNFMIGSLIEEQFKGSAGNWPFGAAASIVLLTMVLLVLMAFSWRRAKAPIQVGSQHE